MRRPAHSSILISIRGRYRESLPASGNEFGIATTSSALQNALRAINDELLLNTSPFVLRVLESVMTVDLQLNGTAADRQLVPEQIVERN